MPVIGTHLTKEEQLAKDKAFDTKRIYVAKVKDVCVKTRDGSIKVWILNSNTNEKDSDSWVIAHCWSNFYGTSTKDKDKTCTSFGWWNPMPCVDNLVFIFYACTYGGESEPFWFGSPIDPGFVQMLPGRAISLMDNKKGSITEIAPNDGDYYTYEDMAKYNIDSAKGYDELNNYIKEQGLENDPLRGYSTATARRDLPSRCYGFTSPNGNTFTIDDGWSINDNSNIGLDDESTRKDVGFRFRTKEGVQVLISNEGTIYANNKDGSAWFELSSDGRIQGYSKVSADIACDGDINFHSKNVYIDCDNMSIRAKNELDIQTKTLGIKSDSSIEIDSPNIRTDSSIYCENIYSKKGVISSIDGYITNAEYANNAGYANKAGAGRDSASGGTVQPPKPSTPSIPTPKPNVRKESEIDAKAVYEKLGKRASNGKKIKSINTFAPCAEPYAGHVDLKYSIEDKIPQASEEKEDNTVNSNTSDTSDKNMSEEQAKTSTETESKASQQVIENQNYLKEKVGNKALELGGDNIVGVQDFDPNSSGIMRTDDGQGMILQMKDNASAESLYNQLKSDSDVNYNALYYNSTTKQIYVSAINDSSANNDKPISHYIDSNGRFQD